MEDVQKRSRSSYEMNFFAFISYMFIKSPQYKNVARTDVLKKKKDNRNSISQTQLKILMKMLKVSIWHTKNLRQALKQTPSHYM